MGQRVVHENLLTPWFLPGGVADPELEVVTAAELGDAILLDQVTVDGININPTNNNASIAMLRGGKIAQRPGTRQKDLTLRFARNDETGEGDIAWELFTYGLFGDLILHRFGDDPQDGAPLEIYRGTSHDPSPVASAQDTYQQFEVPFPCENWNDKASLDDS